VKSAPDLGKSRCRIQIEPKPEGTFRVHDSTRWDTRLAVTTNGNNVIAHAGAATLRLTADRAGLTKALSDTLRREDFTPGHDRGRVLVDAAVMMADGGNTLRAIDVLRHHSDLLGEVASPATLCRALGEIDAACLDDLDAARARVRQRVWNLIVARHGRIPAAEVPSGDLGEQIVLRVDAHFIEATSNKELAQRLRGRFGHHPIAVFCDNTRECLAVQLRRGGAGANDADDHIRVLTRAVTQIPPHWRRNLLITVDGAGATHKLLDWIAAWYYLQGIAADLIAWLKLLGCKGHLARAEPRTLQFQIFHTPATLTRGGRRRWLNLPPDWPWSTHIQAIFDLLFALPVPT